MVKIEFNAPEGKQEIRMTTVLDAPRERVYHAFADPQLLQEWWGPAILTTDVVLHELRTGGRWARIQRDPDGNVFGFHGVYHEVIPGERIVDTFEYEGAPGHVVLETVTFANEGNMTRITEHNVFQSLEDRDEMLQTGMESGARESMQRLEALARR